MKLFASLLIWLCILFNQQMLSQINFKTYESLIKLKPVLLNDVFVDSLLNSSTSTSIDIQKISHSYSIKMYRKRFFFKAIKYAEIEVKSFESLEVFDKNYTNAVYNLGRFYYQNLQFDEAIKNYKKVIKINNYKKRNGQSYGELGRCYRRKNKLYESVNYFKKGILILKELNEYKSLFSQYINLAITFDIINSNLSLENSLEYLQKAENLTVSKLAISKRNRINLNSGFANYYNTDLKYNFKKAKEYYYKNLNLSLKDNDSIVIGSNFINLGELHLREKKDSAIYFLNKSLRYSLNNSTIKADAFRNISKFYLLKNKFKISLSFIDKSINELINKNIFLKDVQDKKLLLSSYKSKIEVLNILYQNSHKIDVLSEIKKTIATADSLIDIIQNNNLNEEKSKLFWRKQASEIYLQGAHVSYLLKNSKSVFYFMEKNKALLLTESISENIEHFNLPKNIYNNEIEMKKNILLLESKIKVTIKKHVKDKLQDSLFDAKHYYQNYLKSIKLKYPKYFFNKQKINQVNISEVQKKLKEGEIVISYIWNHFYNKKEVIIGLIINKDKTEIFKIDDIVNFRNNLKVYRELISKPFETPLHQQNFRKTSFNLFNKLFPLKNIKVFKGKKIFIIPDGELQSIPFEALITKEKTQNYLLNSSFISYQYSMSFLNYNNNIERNTKSNFVGYSPTSFNNLELEVLANSEKEILIVQNTIGGQVVLNDKANKNHFLTESNTSKIIHLATHSDSSKNPWIAFSDEKLELHELYTYKNNADLVVLSACNTSLGEITKGEGVLSLTRGFFYSGAKSVVSSLWSVNDKSTSFIMSDFYKNIKSGQTKDEALTNSKRAYLKAHSLSEKSPYYWSSFILIGDSSSMDLSNKNLTYFIIVLIFCVVVFIFFKKDKFLG